MIQELGLLLAVLSAEIRALCGDRCSIGRLFEAVNGALFVLDVFILGVFWAYLVRQIRDVRASGQAVGFLGTVRYAKRELKGAVSILVFFFGATIARGIVWLWRYMLNEGWRPSGWIGEYQVFILMLGVGICCVGAFCILRVFSLRAHRTGVLIAASLSTFLAATFAFWH